MLKLVVCEITARLKLVKGKTPQQYEETSGWKRTTV
jgi:hypothetical protein